MSSNLNAIHSGYVVERYLGTLRGGAETACAPVLAMRRAMAGGDAGYLRSIVIPADETVFDIFDTARRADVEVALNRAGIRWDRVSNAWLVGDDGVLRLPPTQEDTPCSTPPQRTT